MLELKHELLYEIDAPLTEPVTIGAVPVGQRVIFPVGPGGTFEGPKMKGKVLPLGGDFALIGGNTCLNLDVRAALETDDGARIYMTYVGRVNVEPVADRFFDDAKRGTIKPEELYFRIAPTYETADERYEWLNRIVAVGVGQFTDTGVRYSVYQIL